MSTRLVFAALVSAVLLSSCASEKPSDDRQGQCYHCTVSMKVGPLLKEAQQMIAAKNFEAATVKLDEAEAVKFNPDDEKVISLMRRAIHTMQAQQSGQSQP